jgi:hypothetical protein
MEIKNLMKNLSKIRLSFDGKFCLENLNERFSENLKLNEKLIENQIQF